MRKRFRFKIVVSTLAACMCILLPACGKKGESLQAEASSSPELIELTKQIRRYSFEKRKLPQSMEDLVSAGYIKSVPPAPAGKKYAIDSDRVQAILVNH